MITDQVSWALSFPLHQCQGSWSTGEGVVREGGREGAVVRW